MKFVQMTVEEMAAEGQNAWLNTRETFLAAYLAEDEDELDGTVLTVPYCGEFPDVPVGFRAAV